MASTPRTRNLTTRVFRAGQAPPPRADWEGTTAEERINAVWELTRLCLAWSGSGEPRLQRSVCRIQHLIQNKRATGRTQDLADLERLEGLERGDR